MRCGRCATRYNEIQEPRLPGAISAIVAVIFVAARFPFYLTFLPGDEQQQRQPLFLFRGPRAPRRDTSQCSADCWIRENVLKSLFPTVNRFLGLVARWPNRSFQASFLKYIRKVSFSTESSRSTVNNGTVVAARVKVINSVCPILKPMPKLYPYPKPIVISLSVQFRETFRPSILQNELCQTKSRTVLIVH